MNFVSDNMLFPHVSACSRWSSFESLIMCSVHLSCIQSTYVKYLLWAFLNHATMAKYTNSHDHGYSWIILMGAFMLNVIIVCKLSVMGIFLVEFVETMDTSLSTLSWITALSEGIGNIVGQYTVCVHVCVCVWGGVW